MSQLLDDLRAAREKITDPKNWFKGNWFQTNDGLETEDADVGNICCMCAIGAVACVTGLNPKYTFSAPRDENAWAALDQATRELTNSRFSDIVDYNDRTETTHEEILAVFDRAIANEEAKNVG